MPATSENSPTLRLDPLHSPGSDTQSQEPPIASTLSAQDVGNQEDAMAKTKRRMFNNPLLRRSATASSAAAASAASRIKSNLSTVTKLPTALKRNSANSGSNDDKANVGRAPTIPSLSRSSTDSSVKNEETKATTTNNNRKFAIPSLMRIRTGSGPKDKTQSTASDCPLDSPEAKTSHAKTEVNNNEEATAQIQASAINTASRFVMGMPTLLKRAVSNNHTPPDAAATQKKSPDTSANSTPRGEFPEDDPEENNRHSLLMMMQVPEARRNSQVPLMAANEAW